MGVGRRAADEGWQEAASRLDEEAHSSRAMKIVDGWEGSLGAWWAEIEVERRSPRGPTPWKALESFNMDPWEKQVPSPSDPWLQEDDGRPRLRCRRARKWRQPMCPFRGRLGLGLGGRLDRAPLEAGTLCLAQPRPLLSALGPASQRRQVEFSRTHARGARLQPAAGWALASRIRAKSRRRRSIAIGSASRRRFAVRPSDRDGKVWLRFCAPCGTLLAPVARPRES